MGLPFLRASSLDDGRGALVGGGAGSEFELGSGSAISVDEGGKGLRDRRNEDGMVGMMDLRGVRELGLVRMSLEEGVLG